MVKGVSAILATVLIVLVTVSLSGAFLVYSQRSATQLTETGTNEQQRFLRQSDMQFAIEGVANSRLFLRNIGNAAITSGSLVMFLDDVMINFTLPASIQPGQTGTVYLNDTWKTGLGSKILRVSGGAQADSVQVNVKSPPIASEILHLDLEEGSGTLPKDSSSNAHTTIIRNGGTWSSNTPSSDYRWAVRSDGLNDYIEVQNPTMFDYTGGNLTISMWFWSNSTDPSSFLISRPWNGAGQYNYYISTDSLSVAFSIYGDGGTWHIQTPFVQPNQWNHVYVSVEQGTRNVVLALNGNVSHWVHGISNYTPTQGDINLPLAVATIYPYGEGWVGNNDYTLAGSIDEIRMYSQTYTLEQLYSVERA